VAGAQHQAVLQRQVRRPAADRQERARAVGHSVRQVAGGIQRSDHHQGADRDGVDLGRPPISAVNVGYAAGRSRTDGAFNDAGTGAQLFATSSSDRMNSTIGGIQAGYNWQWATGVAGRRGGFPALEPAHQPAACLPGAICNPALGAVGIDAPVTARFDQGHRLGSFGTLRARLGTTVTPDVMAYATGGLAVASIKTSGVVNGSSLVVTPVVDADGNPVLDDAGNPVTTASAAGAAATFDKVTLKAGWTAGAGLEARLWGNWTGKVEYLYMDFGTISTTVSNPFNSTPINFSSTSRITDHIVRVGLNYKYDPIPAPMLAKPPIATPGAGRASMSASTSVTAPASPGPTASSTIPRSDLRCSPPTPPTSSAAPSAASNSATTGSPAPGWRASKPTFSSRARVRARDTPARARPAIRRSPRSASMRR